jgi:hypothetical protein
MTMNGSLWGHRALVGLILCTVSLTGCPAPKGDGGNAGQGQSGGRESEPAAAPARTSTASAADVDAAKSLLEAFGSNAKCTILPGGVLTEIVIPDGSVLSAQNIALFGKLTDLEKLQIYNFRELNDEMAAQLAGLTNLSTLALTNSVINDRTVDMIAKSFPKLVDLDLSSNTNLTNGVLKVICGITGLERLTLVQNGFNDLGTSLLAKLQSVRALDLRGNMEAGDMTLEVIAALPKLTSLKHRSTAVSDFGMEYLAGSKTLDSLLLQDFAISGQAGQHVAKLGSLTQLEIFRCQGFTSDGVLALKGMKLTRLTLRDLPAVDDSAMEVFTDLPELKRLYLHELASISDSGLQNLASLKSLEVLDIWTLPQMTDATVDVIAALPNLKELSIRTTDVTDATVDKLLAMPQLQSLTFKENGRVTDEGLKKLAGKKWAKLDTGSAQADAGP